MKKLIKKDNKVKILSKNLNKKVSKTVNNKIMIKIYKIRSKMDKAVASYANCLSLNNLMNRCYS